MDNSRQIHQKSINRLLKSIFLLLVFLFTISLSACSRRPLGDKDLINLIPEEILLYSLDGNEKKMSVNNVAIERRQTNNKEDIVYAIITMEDSYIHRTAFYILTINYYDTGGWIIDSWEKYQETKAFPLLPPSEALITSHLNRRFKNFSFISSNIDNLKYGHCSFVYQVNDNEQNLSRSGQTTINYTLIGSDDLSWRPVINNDQINITWNLSGNWNVSHRGEIVGRLNIGQVTSTAIYARYTSNSRSGTGFDQNFSYSISNNGETLSFRWEYIGTRWIFTFSPNSAGMESYNFRFGTQSNQLSRM